MEGGKEGCGVRRREGGEDAGGQGKMKDGGREEEEEEGKQKRAEPAGAAEPPPRRTLGRLGGACGDLAARPGVPVAGPVLAGPVPPVRGPVPPGPVRRSPAGQDASPEAEVRSVSVASAGARVRGDAGRDVRVSRACGGCVCPRWALAMPRQVAAQEPPGIAAAGMRRDQSVLPRRSAGPDAPCPSPIPLGRGCPFPLLGSRALGLVAGLWDPGLVALWALHQASPRELGSRWCARKGPGVPCPTLGTGVRCPMPWGPLGVGAVCVCQMRGQEL